MNTVSKGDQFEDRVFKAIKNELVSERLGLLPKSCQIFRKKKYYSKNRKAHIEIDISIEVFLPEATDWSFLWAMECKDYKGALPVNNVEEFHAKIQQIAGDNVKATLILSGALQKSALEYCKSIGIGVVRLLPDNQIQSVLRENTEPYWVEEEKTEAANAIHVFTEPQFVDESRDFDEEKTEEANVIDALTEPEFVDGNRDFYALQNKCFYKDWFSLIEATLSKICANK